MAKKQTKKATKKAVKTSSARTTKKTVGKTTRTATKPKTTKKPETKGVVLKRNGTDAQGNAQYSAIQVYAKKPAGWKENKTSAGAPAGYKIIHNGKTASSGQRRIGLIKVK